MNPQIENLKTDKTKVKRAPKRGYYDKETINRIMDNDFICQIGFVYNDYPVVILQFMEEKMNTYIFMDLAQVD